MECHIYLQNLDDETFQLLQLVSNELNEVFSNSQPEPINIEWSEGQSVIVQYHLDNMWYRGTIIKINEIEEKVEFTVQFCDYGNIETCTHENLRSTLYMTDVPQLCVKGFFSTILPMTKDRKWPIPALDFIHSMIVERRCMVIIDESLSTKDIYAIKCLNEIQQQLDVCQYLVTNKLAHFEYITTSIIELMDTDEEEKDDATDNNYYNDDDSGEIYNEGEQTYDDVGGTNNDDEQTYNNIGETNNDDEHTYNNIGETNNDDEQTYNNIEKTNNDNEQTYNNIGETNNNDEQIYNNIGETNSVYESTYDNRSMAGHSVDDKRWNSVDALSSASAMILDEEEEFGYSKFCLEANEVFEGTMCRITGPTSLMLVITKIGGADLSVTKNRMYNEMYNKCGTLPPLDHIVPGLAVTVIHNGLWKRGVIEDDGNSVLLVDFGTSIKLIKKNLRPCPTEFLQLPMFTIDCRLENVRLGDDADAKEVVNKLSKTLRGINLKIVGIVSKTFDLQSESDNDIVGVELYNSKEEIAYQPLIDAKLLIPE
ncbi:hypothetical protein AGLY_008643 [Aphis glycines]|uniref:Tudor domain-containing protein n=1 Tax=Aphis glycines TaxID=307491 RepID=A0A6G0TMV4_APHGL|nr:hypothetical protein AGLY_008643 [Aphis glycines]